MEFDGNDIGFVGFSNGFFLRLKISTFHLRFVNPSLYATGFDCGYCV